MIIFISCGKKKLNHPAKAKDLYCGNFFKAQKEYALRLVNGNENKIFILSAKYGLVNMGGIIAPYEKTLSKMKADEIKKWTDKVIAQMRKKINFNERAIFLCGSNYYKYIEYLFPDKIIIGKGLSMGKKIALFKRGSRRGNK